ncbi:S41 family peptidase [Chryseobacterium kwangjuense]|nr:S41 family peptidase [Chryseobacterium kwangjuense]
MKKLISVFCLVIVQSLVYGQKEQYNLFIRTWNFLKYYHPDLAGGKINSDSLFLTNIEKVNQQTDTNSVIRILSEKLNQNFSGNPVIDQEKDILSVNQDFSWYQKNKKISPQNKNLLNTIYQHRLITQTDKKQKQDEEKKKESLPKDKNLPLAERLLIFAKIQGSIDYLYPHKYLMPKNSDAYFADLLEQTIQCSTRKDFEVILAKAVAKMEDTHAFKFYNQLSYKNEIYHRSYYPPFDYTVFDDHILITDLILPEICSKANIRVGDRIMEINGKKISKIIKEKQKLLSVSNPETLVYMLSDYQRNLIWTVDDAQKELKIQSKQDRKTYSQKVDFINFTDKQQLATVTEYIKEKIRSKDEHTMTHVDVAHFKIYDVRRILESVPEDQLDDHMDKIFKEASTKKAIVFDMRGYPDWGGFVYHYIYKYFSPVENHFGKYYKPNIRNIGTYIPSSYKEFGLYYPKIENKTTHPYKGKVFIIVNPETLSLSEWSTMNLQKIFPQAMTIGQKTAGADGDVTSVPLNADYNLEFTANGIFYYDNEQTQKTGIRINELIRYTDEDILQKRDLEFEKVLREVK